MEALVERISEALLAWGPQALGALITLVLGWLLARLARGLVRRGLGRAGVDQILVRFAGTMTYLALLALVVIAALGQLGVNTTSFAAVLAAAGLAVGLAFQDSLSNFSAGVLLMIFRPFGVGDFVEAAGVSGSVEEVQIFTTVLKTPDNKKVIVGNGSILGSSITNYSAYATRRVDMVFGIAYGDDIGLAKATLERILGEDERILAEPEPVVAVLALADSSVNLAVRPWVAKADYWPVFFAVHEKVKTTFDGEGLSIPFPQTDVHLHQRDAA